MKKATITLLQVFSIGAEDTFVVRICDNFKTAKSLLNQLFEDASNNEISTKTGATLSNPMWLNSDHTRLQITQTIACVGLKIQETYTIHEDSETNLFSANPL